MVTNISAKQRLWHGDTRARVIMLPALVVLTALALSATVRTVHAETLREVVQMAVETNPLVGVAAKRKDAADAAVDAARSGYFLKLDWQHGAGVERSQNSTTLATGNQWVRMNRCIDTMVASQMLWDGLGTRAEVERRRAISDAAAFKVHNCRGCGPTGGGCLSRSAEEQGAGGLCQRQSAGASKDLRSSQAAQ